MYLPSMFFGGSSLLHLLAGHPRVVAAFGLIATLGMTVNVPFGAQPVPGTTLILKTLDQRVSRQEASDPAVVARARRSAFVLSQTSEQELTLIVTDILNTCGRGCADLTPSAVLNAPTLLNDVLLIHELDRLGQSDRENPGVREYAVPVARRQ